MFGGGNCEKLVSAAILVYVVLGLLGSAMYGLGVL